MNTIESNKLLREDKQISIAIMSPFVVLVMQFFLLHYFNAENSNLEILISNIAKAIVALFFLITIKTVFRRSKKEIIFTYCTFILIFAMNYLLFYNTVNELNNIVFEFFFISLLLFIYSYSIKNITIFNNVVIKLSNIIFAVGLLIGLLVIFNIIYFEVYNMALGYYLLLPAVIYIKKFFEKKSIKFLILSFISILIIVSLGSRGPLICIGVYIILYQVINIRRLSINKILSIITTLISIILIIVNFWNLINLLEKIFYKFNIDSRTLSMLYSEQINLSGREKLYFKVIYLIKSNPIIGIGLAGDRYNTGTYAHNIFLEIFAGYGVVLGSIIISILLLLILRGFLIKDSILLNQILVWFSIGFIPLLVSGSYLTYYQFWVFLGFLLSVSKKMNYRSKLEQVINLK